MGIFTKRKVLAGEELTFNYNVDRYGCARNMLVCGQSLSPHSHDAQECFCGESNCVGWIGGKTQTDIGAMDDLYLDALGITDDVENFGMKGSKKRKGRKLDIDFIVRSASLSSVTSWSDPAQPVLRPIELSEAPRVASAIRQATSIQRILTKLLQRVQLTTDAVVQRQLMRLHGISLMASVLAEYETDATVTSPVIEILLGWPLITRNKLVSSNIEPLVERLTLSIEEGVAVRAQELVKFWATLELGYRIPKAVQDALSDANNKRRANDAFDSFFAKRPRIELEEDLLATPVEMTPKYVAAAATEMVEEAPRLPPAGWKMARSGGGVPYYYNEVTSQTSWVFPDAALVASFAAEWAARQRERAEAIDVNDILGQARREQEEREAARVAEEAAQIQLRADRKAAAIAKAKRKEAAKVKAKAKAEAKAVKLEAAAKKAAQRDPVKEKEKALLRAFGGIVVNTMSKRKAEFDTDQFKRRAKEVRDPPWLSMTCLGCDRTRRLPSSSATRSASRRPLRRRRTPRCRRTRWPRSANSSRTTSASCSPARRPLARRARPSPPRRLPPLRRPRSRPNRPRSRRRWRSRPTMRPWSASWPATSLRSRRSRTSRARTRCRRPRPMAIRPTVTTIRRARRRATASLRQSSPPSLHLRPRLPPPSPP
jgi:histone-lysine N-methyltransferase SETD2